MKNPDPTSQFDPNDPERLLRTRLRTTTPEFERRFDDLRRQLAQEPKPSEAMWPWTSWVTQWRFIGVAAVMAAFVVGIISFQTTRHPPSSNVTFGELLALNDTLEGAIPLTDTETRTAVLLLPTSTTP